MSTVVLRAPTTIGVGTTTTSTTTLAAVPTSVKLVGLG